MIFFITWVFLIHVMTKVKNRISSKQKNDILVKNIIVININDLIFGVSLFGFFLWRTTNASRNTNLGWFQTLLLRKSNFLKNFSSVKKLHWMSKNSFSKKYSCLQNLPNRPTFDRHRKILLKNHFLGKSLIPTDTELL